MQSDKDRHFGAVRSAVAFFLMTFSTAYLFTIGVKLTGGFTRSPDIPAAGLQQTGLSIIIGVAILIVGAALRRLTAAEMQSALLGASAVLLATPVAAAVLSNDWGLSTAVVSGFGLLTLVFGLLIAFMRSAESNADE
ncbi:hypothetical protein [Asticcacaulis sp. EMRT-3]|uniref:hypothetical protein n=1 Tax=Asticcacaulis sp. EMRT-3 TaxID=3040349 RepID=UPI0024AEA782|nr:hypothetical protein [Asticcacaulis sp. EMRT-3]MDI7774456.1 hypothetical protein [Asticcacaulis sp. EMRT-3]